MNENKLAIIQIRTKCHYAGGGLEGVWPGLFQFEMKPTPKEKVVLEGTDQIQLEPDDGIVRSYLISNNKGSFLVVSEARRCLRNEWKETAKS